MLLSLIAIFNLVSTNERKRALLLGNYEANTNTTFLAEALCHLHSLTHHLLLHINIVLFHNNF